MDSMYIRDGILIDVVDKEWMLDKIPFADVNVPLEELPDSEANDLNGNPTQTLKELEMKWTETGLHKLLDQISGSGSQVNVVHATSNSNNNMNQN